MICGLILNVSWNANLISYLTTHKISMPFESLEKLLQATNFKIAIIPESAQEDNFKLSSDPIKQEIYKERIKPYLYDFDSYSGRCIWIATFISIPIYQNTLLKRYSYSFLTIDISAKIPSSYPDTALYGGWGSIR